jgi:hypothetical protein
VIRPAPVAIHWRQNGGKNRRSSMIAAPYFTVDLFELKEPQEFSPPSVEENDSGKTSVQILVAVEGCGVVEAQGRDPVTFAKGDAVVIPAAVRNFHGASAVGSRVSESPRASCTRAGDSCNRKHPRAHGERAEDQVRFTAFPRDFPVTCREGFRRAPRKC